MAYLDFSVECVVLACPYMVARVPFEASLSGQDVVLEDVLGVAPLFEAKTPSCSVFLVVCRTSHHLSCEPH